MILHELCGRTRRLRDVGRLAAAVLTIVLFNVRPAPGEIRDEGAFFKPETVDKVREQLQQLKQKQGLNVLIETYAQIPEDRRAQYKEGTKEAFYAGWARERVTTAEADIVVLITRQPGRFQIAMNDATRAHTFTDGDRSEIQAQILTPAFREREFDRGITEAVKFIEGKVTTGPGAPAVRGVAEVPRGRGVAPPSTLVLLPSAGSTRS